MTKCRHGFAFQTFFSATNVSIGLDHLPVSTALLNQTEANDINEKFDDCRQRERKLRRVVDSGKSCKTIRTESAMGKLHIVHIVGHR